MAVALRDLPKFVVLEPTSTLRVDMRLDHPACEIDVSLDNPRPGRSFVLLIGHAGGPFVQRVRLAGRARILFDPKAPGNYVLLFANPDRQPLVLRLRVRGIGAPIATVRRSRAPGSKRGSAERRGSRARPSRAAAPRGRPSRRARKAR